MKLVKLLLLFLTCSTVCAAPSLKVTISGVKDKAIRDNVEAYLLIMAEQKKSIQNEDYIRYLAEAGVEQAKRALEPFGYYLSTVKLDLAETPKQWTAKYSLTLGEPVKVGDVDVRIAGDGKDDRALKDVVAEFPLKTGDRLRQAPYEAFKGKVMTAAATHGYFDGKFATKQIKLNDELDRADITLVYESGTRYRFGEATFEQDILVEDLPKRYATFEQGEPFDTQKIADTQRDLYNSEYFKLIKVDTPADKGSKTVPVNFVLTKNKNKKYKFSLGYGTDTGFRAGFDFDWRWVHRYGHKLKTRSFVSEKQIDLSADYIIPGRKPATDNYKIFGNYHRDMDAGDVDAYRYTFGGAYEDQVGKLHREFGVKYQYEDFHIGSDRGSTTLIAPYVGLTYRSVDKPLNVFDGLVLNTEMTGASESLGSTISFYQAVVRGYGIKRFGEHKGLVRAAVGRTWTDDFHKLPPSYRFFSGGDRTIRGYAFNSVGERDAKSANLGGDKMVWLSGEYEYFFDKDMSSAVFVDAGDVWANEEFKLRIGAGLGFRYYSPIGPIKIDAAHGLNYPGDGLRFHLSIGPEL